MIGKSLSAALAALCLFAVGCAPMSLVEGIQYTADRYGVRSAETLSVANRGHLRFDHALLSDLDDVLSFDELGVVKSNGERVLNAAHALAVETVNREVERMPPDALGELVRRYRLPAAPANVDERRVYIENAFAEQSRPQLERDLARLRSCTTAGDALWFLRTIRNEVEPPPGDRGKVARALLAGPLFIPAAIGAEVADAEATQRMMTADFGLVAVYEPPNKAERPSVVELERADVATLASWYAPVFVQQVNPDAAYAKEDDAFGRVYLSGTPDNIAVHVNTAEPVVYWAHQQAKVGRRLYDQLVYVTWYPRRPAMTPNDASAGDIDGVVVRITLDRHHRPAIYEFVRSCGCYHTLWVAEFVEAAAREEYGSPPGDSGYAVRRSDVKRELFFPELVRDDGANPHRPMAFVSAGYHLLMTVHPLDSEPIAGTTDRTLTYVLEPYDNLTRLPLGGGVASMFGGDGLVHDAGRAEGWLLAPTGMLSAGQPRQLGTMKIRMDAYDYDDPRLLEENLRLPNDF